MPTSISRDFSRWAVQLSYDDLGPEVVDKLKALVLFHLVADCFGALEPRARRLVELVKSEDAEPDGATILTDGAKVTRTGAALANCELAHAAGLWDSFRMITHPGPVLVAVALANGELGGSSGREFLTALAAGYEFSCRLAEDFVPSTSARGFRPAPIFATMGGAMVAGKLAALDEDGLVAAIAIASSAASGLNEPGRVGGDDRDFQEPNAARQAVFSAQMASLHHGQPTESSIEGEAGFYAAFAGSHEGRLSHVFTGPRRVDLATLTAELGSRWLLRQVMFRMYNTSGYNQPVIDLMAELKHEHELDPADVDEVLIAMNYLETLYPSPDFPRYADPSVTRVGSIQYFAAHAAVNGGYPVVGGATYGPTGEDLEGDEAVLAFMAERVRLIGVHDQAMFSPEITVRLTSGRAVSATWPYSRMAWGFAELCENLRRCLPGLPGGEARLEELTGLAAGLDGASDLTGIIEAMRPR